MIRSDRPPSGAIGRAVGRREDRALLLGSGQFVDDLHLDGMLHARFVRSPFAHGSLLGIDTEAAEATPGTIAVLTAADLDLPPIEIPLEDPGVLPLPRPVLAERVVRFVGEAVAVVLADSPYAAEDGAEAVLLDIDPRPAVVDCVAGAAPDAPLVHDYTTNVLFERQFEAGEGVDAAFCEARVVVEATLVSPRSSAAPMEPRGLVAAPAPDGGLHVWASTQVPHQLATVLAQVLGLDLGKIRVMSPDVGGGFGQKAHVYPEDVVVSAVAIRSGRPIKWVEDRAENLIASSHAHDQTLRVRAAADREGRLLAIDADILCDVGAWGLYAHGHPLEAAGSTPSMIPGPYRLPAYRYRSRAVCTNKAPIGGYRGVGMPVAVFVHERLMDKLAEASGVDPAEIRRRNLISTGELPYTSLTGHRYDSGDYPRALALALERIGYHSFPAEQIKARANGRLLGLGIACCVEYSAPNARAFSTRGMVGLRGFDDAFAALGDEEITIWTTLPSTGQGLHTTFAQMAADALDLPLDAVEVARPDTAVGPLDGTGTLASRSAVAGGGAVCKAVSELRRRMLDDAGQLLEVAVADLEFVRGRVQVKGASWRGVGWQELVERADDDRYRVAARFDPEATTYPYGVHACRVEIEAATGRVAVTRYVVVEDCGPLINPMIVEGQVHGGVAQGLAGALFEKVVYDEDGQIVTGSLMDFLMPTAAELPSVELVHLETPAPSSPNGAKGVGESGALAPGAAVANAVTNALLCDCDELPVQPEWVRERAQALLEDGKAHRRSAVVQGGGR